MCNILDSTEAQLRFGYALYHSSDVVTAHPTRDRTTTTSRERDEEALLRSSHSLHVSSQRRTTRGILQYGDVLLSKIAVSKE